MSGSSDSPNPGKWTFDMPVQEAKFKEVVQELKRIPTAGSDEEKATLKRIWDMFADMRDTSTFEQFEYLVFHLDGRFTKVDLTHTLNYLGKDASKPLNFKDFTDWYHHRDQLKQDSQAGRPTKRTDSKPASASSSATSSPVASTNTAGEITDGKKSLKRTASFRKTFSILTKGEDEKPAEKEKEKEKDKDKKEKDKKVKDKKEKKDKHSSSSGSQILSNKAAPSPRRTTEPVPLANDARTAASALRGNIDKEAYKKAMLERYEAQQRENAEILKKKKEEEEMKRSTLGRSSTGANLGSGISSGSVTSSSTLNRSTIASQSFYLPPSTAAATSPAASAAASPKPMANPTPTAPQTLSSPVASQPTPTRSESIYSSTPARPSPQTTASPVPTLTNRSFEAEIKAQDDLIAQLNQLASISPRFTEGTVVTKAGGSSLSAAPAGSRASQVGVTATRTAGAPSIVVASTTTAGVTPVTRSSTGYTTSPVAPAPNPTTVAAPLHDSRATVATSQPAGTLRSAGTPGTLRSAASTMEILMSSITDATSPKQSARISPRPSGIYVAQPKAPAFVDPELQALNEELAQIERERTQKREAETRKKQADEEARKMNELLAIASGNPRHSLMKPTARAQDMTAENLVEKKRKEEELQRSLELMRQQREMEEKAAAEQARAVLNAPLTKISPRNTTPRNDDLQAALAAVESQLRQAGGRDEKERAATAELHRIEAERQRLETERIQFQREQEEMKRSIERDREENIRKQQEQDSLRQQLENERIENLKRAKEADQLQRLASLERQLLQQQNEEAKVQLRAQFELNESLMKQRADEEELRRQRELAEQRELEEMKRVEERIQQKREEVRRFKQEQQFRRSAMVTGEQMRSLQAAITKADMADSEKLRLEKERLRLEKEEMERIEAEKQAIIAERKRMEEERLRREREHAELRLQYERERSEAAKILKAQEELRAELMRKKQEEDRALEAQLMAEDEELRLMELKIQQKRNALQAKRKAEEEERLRRLEQLEQKEDVDIQRRRELMDQKMAELNQQLRETQMAELKQQQDRIREIEERLRQVKVTGGRTALASMDPQVANMLDQQQAALARMQQELLNHTATAPTITPATSQALPSEIAAALSSLKEKEKQLKDWEERNLQMQALMARMSKLDRFETLMAKIEAGELVPRGPLSPGAHSYAELKAEIEELQKVLFSDTATAKEKEDANIRLEKAMTAFEQTPEAREAVRRAKEERRAKNEPLNRAALAAWRARWTPDAIRRDDQMLRRIAENPELRLLLVDPELISRMHQNDFKAYVLKNITLEEMRGIRANMPVWRKDQQKQQEWQDSLDDRIDAAEAALTSPKGPPPAKKAPTKMPPLPKAKPAAGSGAPTDLFAELLAKKNTALKRTADNSARSSVSGDSNGSAVSSVPSSRSGSVILNGRQSVGQPSSPASPGYPPLPPLPSATYPSASAPLSPVAQSQSQPLPQSQPVKFGTNLTSTDLAALRAAASAGSATPPAALSPSVSAPVNNTGNQLRLLNDALLKLTNLTRDEKEIASDTRSAVAELKKFCTMHMARNAPAAQALEATAPELVVAVKKALAARNRNNDVELREASAEIQRVCRKINDGAFDLML